MELQNHAKSDQEPIRPATPDTESIESAEEEDRRLMEQFLSNPAHDFRNLQYGDTVDGTVMRVDREEILVDIGSKAEGIVPAREMQSFTTEDRAALRQPRGSTSTRINARPPEEREEDAGHFASFPSEQVLPWLEWDLILQTRQASMAPAFARCCEPAPDHPAPCIR